uniref:Acyl-CoA synthetases (AMP-forming)/AMP-acid ligases II-like protein n=1 Tax=Chlorobium chlorochromatii (strain CaD3) TaxID=340177 RepID=Q3ARY0_CHLCH
MKNFTEILTQQALKQPDAIAVIREDEHISYQRLEELVWQCVMYLYQQGVREGDVVVHIFEDELLIVIAMLANARMGATMLSVPETVPKNFLQETIKEVNVSFILSDLHINNSIHLNAISLKKEFFKEIKADKSIYVENPKVPWLIIIGSGSTGKQKLIPIDHDKFINRLELTKNWFPIIKSDIVTSFTPLDYGSAKEIFCQTLTMSATYFLLPKNKISIYLINKYHITILHSTVFHIEKLLQNIAPSSRQTLNKLKILLMGASRISSNLRQRIKSILTNNLYVRYGTNELGTVSITSIDKVFSSNETVGFSIKGIELEIVNENGSIQSKDKPGVIRIKSPAMINGYLNDKEASKKAFKNGWFYPGDIGKFTEDGQLIHVGRADDMMIMNGINIYPSQIENAILQHPDVEEAFAFPLKHKIAQDLPVCAVVLKKESNVSQKILMHYAHEHLGAYSPQLIVILDKDPRNQQGKIVRTDLIKIVQQKIQEYSKKDINLQAVIPMRYKQTFTKTQITLKKNIFLDISLLDSYLNNVFDIIIEKLSFNELSTQKTYLFNIAWRYLLLRKSLLQAINIPVFDTGKVISITENEDKFIIALHTPVITNIPLKIYKNINNLTGFVLPQIAINQNKNKIESLYKQIMDKLNALKKQIDVRYAGKSTLPILQVAHKKQIPFEHLGSGLYQLGWGKKLQIISRSASWHDSFIGALLSENKILASKRLKNAGFPVPKHAVANTFEEALNIAKKLKFPLVTKPIDLNRSEGVSVDIVNEELLQKGFELANKNKKAVIIEQQIAGVCTRVFIANHKMYYAVKRLPKSVVGDGKHTIQQLIILANQKNEKLPPWKRTEYFPSDNDASIAIKNAGFIFDDIVEDGRLVPLRKIESAQWGGYDEDVTHTIHPDNIAIALRAAELFGLQVAGIDIISPDITKPWYANGAIINEVNFAPLYGGGEIARSTISEFLDDLIDGDGRIPITVLVGDDNALKQAKKLQEEAIKRNKNVYISTHNQTFNQHQNEVIITFNSLFQRTKALLMNQEVEALILVVQTDEWLRTGLPIDTIDNLIMINKNIQDTTHIPNVFGQLITLLKTVNGI